MAEASSHKNTTASSQKEKDVNEIHQNEIWRQQIKYESDCARSYGSKWGFMLAPKSAQKLRQATEKPRSPYASGLPSRMDRLIDETILLPQQPAASNRQSTDEFTVEEMKAVYMLTHQVRKLQLANGMPQNKYSYPATSGNEMGWWLADSSKRYRSNGKARTGPAYDPSNSLCDYKLTRWSRG